MNVSPESPKPAIGTALGAGLILYKNVTKKK